MLVPHLSKGTAPILSLDSVFDVLRAANYLQMDEAQTIITDYVKAHISKADFLDAYNFARQTKIDCLTGTIETTIVRPEEVTQSCTFYNLYPLLAVHEETDVWSL